jgi:ATP synthase protein I
MSEKTSFAQPLETGATKVVVIQSLLIAGIGGAFYFYQGQLAAQSAFYGGCMVVFNVWLTHHRLQTAAEIAIVAPGKEVNMLYFAAIQRFVFTITFFAIGMGLLKLLPIPLLITFAVAHLGYLFSGRSNTFKFK